MMKITAIVLCCVLSMAAATPLNALAEMPDYLTVPDFKSCLNEVNHETFTSFCLISKKEDKAGCKQETLDKLKACKVKPSPCPSTQ